MDAKKLLYHQQQPNEIEVSIPAFAYDLSPFAIKGIDESLHRELPQQSKKTLPRLLTSTVFSPNETDVSQGSKYWILHSNCKTTLLQ